MRERDVSVSGDFTESAVLGDPADLLASSDFIGGWDGYWIPELTTTQEQSLRRSAVDPTAIRYYTSDLGATWTTGPYNIDPVKSTTPTYSPVGYIQIVDYKAFARQTKASNNIPVINNDIGLSDIFVTCNYQRNYGALLAESLLGKPVTSDILPVNENHRLTSYYLDVETGLLYTLQNTYEIRHDVTSLPAPSNGSSAVKSLMYQVEISSQASLNLAYRELRYGTSWDDDGLIDITNGDNVKTGSNGDVFYGIHTLSIPYGWV
jgi:hypothetical protein